MRVLAASFRDHALARAARTRLIEEFALDRGQIGVEALAHARTVSDAAILAGRFEDDVVAAARAVVEQLGGTLVIDIDDRGQNG
jgi:adenine deaminase